MKLEHVNFHKKKVAEERKNTTKKIKEEEEEAEEKDEKGEEIRGFSVCLPLKVASAETRPS